MPNRGAPQKRIAFGILHFDRNTHTNGAAEDIMIEFKDVKKVYPNGTVALDGVNLKIADGEFVFIVGESGAGKTTLMKLLLREEKISDGTLAVRCEKQNGNRRSVVEYNLSKLSNFKVPYYRRELGVVFQDFRLFPNKTVFENVAFAMQVVGESSRVIM